ncbi:MAG: hypothetical protein Q9169_001868 [Polycauliona sp. 2 TL-2023]
MPAPSLAHITRQKLIKNILNGWELTDIADTRYEVIRPVLMKTANPNQLKILEKASPQLYGVDAEIWISLIKRDVPKAEEKLIHPKNPKKWWRVYDKMLEDHKKEAEEDAIKLKAAFKGIKEAKKPPPAILDGVPHLPKLGGMERAHLLKHNQCYAKKKKVEPGLSAQRIGKGVMAKVRREAMEQSQRFKAFPNPKDRLNSLVSQVPVPPRHMVEQYQKSQALGSANLKTPNSATTGPSRSTIFDQDRPRLSAVQLMDEQNRQHAQRLNMARAGTSTPPARPEKRVRAPPKDVLPSGPGRFNNVMFPHANKKRRMA